MGNCSCIFSAVTKAFNHLTFLSRLSAQTQQNIYHYQHLKQFTKNSFTIKIPLPGHDPKYEYIHIQISRDATADK